MPSSKLHLTHSLEGYHWNKHGNGKFTLKKPTVEKKCELVGGGWLRQPWMPSLKLHLTYSLEGY